LVRLASRASQWSSLMVTADMVAPMVWFGFHLWVQDPKRLKTAQNRPAQQISRLDPKPLFV
jgi:hypothetical protein